MPRVWNARWLAHVVGAALMTATLLNGLASFSRRVGVIDREDYGRYWAERCGPAGVKPLAFGLGRQCVEVRKWSAFDPVRTSLTAYVGRVDPWEWPLKAAKDVTVGALIVVGGLLSLRAAGLPTLRRIWLPALLCLYVLVWAVFMVATDRTMLALAGLRSFSFLPIALLWASTVSADFLARIARWSLALVGVQCLLIPSEILAGVADRLTSWLRIRAAGTLVHPNTLGILAVASVGFGLSHVRTKRFLTLLWAATLTVVVGSGSGVGWVALLVLGFAEVAPRIGLSPLVKVLGALTLALLCLSTLATLTGRPDVLHSVLEGRLLSLGQAIHRGDARGLVLGRGLGVGTNTAMTTLGATSLPADSMVTLLLLQAGLIGLLLFYGLLLQAWHSSPRGRPFFLSMFVASLVSNVTEVFPVNVLLGLSLADAIGSRREPDAR